MSTANIYTKEKVDELLGKYFVLPSNITINTNGITIGNTTIGNGTITTSTGTINTKLVLNGKATGDVVGNVDGNMIPYHSDKYVLGTNGRRWERLFVNDINEALRPCGGIWSEDFYMVYNGTSYPVVSMISNKKYSSYANSMVTTSTSLYLGNSYWNYDCNHNGNYKALKICMGTFIKGGGDNTRKHISFPITFSSAPLVILQMGGGNAPGSVQYRNGELVAEITISGFTTASGCSEQARMCYIAIGW